jgi:hypothetical protein
MDSLSNCASAFKNSRHVRWDRLEYAEKVASKWFHFTGKEG